MARRTIAGLLLLAATILFFSARHADAAQVATVAMTELFNTIEQSMDGWLDKAGTIALHILAMTAIIGFGIGIKDLVLAGNLSLDGTVALFVRFAFIVGLLVWLLNAPLRLAMITKSIKMIGSRISGQSIDFSSLMDLFQKVVNPLVEFTAGLGWRDIGLIICMTFLIFLINCLFFLIAATVLVVEIEAIFILIGGLFTASFFVIGYFRDYFMGYIKALVNVGMKMLMLSLCLGTMSNIMGTWPAMIQAQLNDSTGVFSFLMPMACALIGFYMIVKAVPQYAASILTGMGSHLDGGAVRGAVAAGMGAGMTVYSMSRSLAHGTTSSVSAVSQAAQAYQHTTQAAKDTGTSNTQSRAAGAWDAVKTVFAGASHGSPRSSGEQIYSDYHRSQEFHRDGGGMSGNGMAVPGSSTTGPGASGVRGSSPRTSSGIWSNPEGFDAAINQGKTVDRGDGVGLGFTDTAPGGFSAAANQGKAAQVRPNAQTAQNLYDKSPKQGFGASGNPYHVGSYENFGSGYAAANKDAINPTPPPDDKDNGYRGERV